MRRLLPALLLLALAAPSTASALTVEANGEGYVEVKGGDGEANDVTVAREGKTVLVRDTAAPLVVNANCERQPDGSARCAVPDVIGAGIVETGDGDDLVRIALTQEDEMRGDLGAGNDRLEGSAGSLWIEGGEGDDVMTDTSAGVAVFEAQAGNDRVDGGPGGDVLSGGSGDDVVLGGPGSDTLGASDKDEESSYGDQGRGNDTYDGGPGSGDIVSYKHRTIGVKVDIGDPAPDGGAGEADTITAIENVEGSGGSDELRGDDGKNLLLGLGGGDVMDGRGGNDRVWAGYSETRDNLGLPKPDRAEGGPGNDDVRSQEEGELSGGPGNDRLSTGATASATCGPGVDDVIVFPATTPPLDRTCEFWDFAFTTLSTGLYDRVKLPTVRAGAVRVTVPCRRQEPGGCVYTMRATTTSGAVLGIGRGTVRGGGHATLTAKLRSTPSSVRVLVLMRQGRGKKLVKAGVTVPSR